MKKKQENSISFGFLLVGLFFLWNPLVRLFDVLPDGIGYLFILLSIKKVRDILPDFEEVFFRVKRLLHCEIGRLVAILISSQILESHTADRTLLATFMLAYDVVQLIFAFKAFQELFHAFSNCTEKYGIKETAGTTLFKKNISTEFLASFTFVMMIVRNVASFIPESLFLFITDPLEKTETPFAISNYYNRFIAGSFLLMLILGLFWFIVIRKYFKGCQNSPEMRNLYESIIPCIPSEYRIKKAKFRRESLGLGFFLAALFFTMDFELDFINVLPDFVFSVLMFFGCFILFQKKKSKKKTAFLGLTILHFLASVFDFVVTTIYYQKYDVSYIGRIKAADFLYSMMKVSVLTKSILEIGIVVLLTILYTNYLKNVFSHSHQEVGLLHGDREVLKEFQKKYIGFVLFGVVDAILSVVTVLLHAVVETVSADEDVLKTSSIVIEKYGFFWIIVFFLCMIWFAYSYFLTNDMRAEVKSSYGIDE